MGSEAAQKAAPALTPRLMRAMLTRPRKAARRRSSAGDLDAAEGDPVILGALAELRAAAAR